MYYINKAVAWVASPLGMAFIGLAAAWVAHRKWPRLARWLAGLSAVMLWLMGCGVTTRLVGLGLESEWSRAGAMHGSIDGLPDAEAIVVLGGGVGAHEECRAPELLSGADRLWQGARLYAAKKRNVPGLRVFCTGGGCEHTAVPFLEALGVPREAIWFSEQPRNTEEEARLLKAEMAGNSPRILLVTSAWHMARARMLFRRAGFDVIPAPTDFEMNCAAERPLALADFFPCADALLRNSAAVKEWVGLMGCSLLRR